MGIFASISRFAGYYKRNGLRATVRRVGLAARRALFSSRMVIFYCDIRAEDLQTATLPSSLKVERHRNQTDLSPNDLEEITSFWNPTLAQRDMHERFEQGAL